MKLNLKHIGLGALILAISSILSRVLGLLRDVLIAKSFGSGQGEAIFALDTYFLAFRIPDLIYTLLIMGAISATFLPIYTKVKLKSADEAHLFASRIINLLLILMLPLIILLWIFTEPFIQLISPGFDLVLQEQTVNLTRIMLFSPFFLGLSAIFQGVENSHKSFIGMALAPIFYNLSIICGAYFFADIYGVKALTWAVLIGSILHFLIQVPWIFKLKFKYSFDFNFKNQNIKNLIKMSIPRLFGISFTQINILIDTILASLLMLGSLSIYNYALNLQSLPHGIVAVSVSMAVFASLSELSEKPKLFLKTVSKSLDNIMFWILPAVLGIFFLRFEIVELLFQRGAFTAQDTASTAFVLGFFIWASIGQSIVPLISRAFYSLDDTKRPVLISISSGLLQIFLSLYFILVLDWGVWALALSTVISTSLCAILMLIFMSKKLNSGILDLLPKKIPVKILNLFLMSALVLFLKTLNYPNVFFEVFFISILGVLFYFSISKITKTIPSFRAE